MSTKKDMKGKIFILIIFVLATLGLITGGLYMILKTVKDKDLYAQTTATITRIESEYFGGELEYDVYVTYEVDGVTYEDVYINWWNNLMTNGQEIKISYLKTNPEKIKSEKENYTVGIILLVMGAIFIVGDVSMAYELIKEKL